MNKDWKDTDLYKFTSMYQYQDIDVEVWGGFGKNEGDGFIPFGWIVGSTTMDYEYFFDIDGKLIKTKVR